MASVTSLGLHQPSALQHAVEENILPLNAPSDSYRWIIEANKDGNLNLEDELLITKTAVIWSRGSVVCKTFRFDQEKEDIITAFFAYFPSPSESKQHSESNKRQPTTTTAKPSTQKSLIVFLKAQAHVYYLSGTSHVVHMPFEIETACAGPIGVLVQRKLKSANASPADLRFPRVTVPSFISSQVTELGSSQQSFSFEASQAASGPNIIANTTLQQLLDDTTPDPTSQWPRIVSLTDPFLEVGLVVTDTEAPSKLKLGKQRKLSSFLEQNEELLHVEQIPLSAKAFMDEELVIGITANRDINMYTIWRLKYLAHDDPFIRKRKDLKRAATRRRSSIVPTYIASQTTPAKGGIRDSFGSSMSGKRTRYSERTEHPVDLVSSLEQQDKEGTGIGRRSSRRLSSMLARADLSTSQERSIFTDQVTSHAAKRHDSYNQFHGRNSSSYNYHMRPSLSSLLEAPLDAALHEGFHNMGIDDNEFDGLQRDVLFSRIYQIPLDKSTAKIGSDPMALSESQSKVFTLCSPSFSADEHSQNQLLIGIQDVEEKRLNIIILEIALRPASTTNGAGSDTGAAASIAITSADFRKAKNVVDSCKLIDGNQSAILVLSESIDGRHELSTQAPWSERTTICPELVFVDATRSLQYIGRKADRDIQQRKSEVIDLLNGNIVGVRYPRNQGVVDALDIEGRFHQLRIQMKPRNPQVQRVLAMCRSVLEDSLGDRIHAGWLHIMQWLQTQNEPIADVEWSSLTVLLFTLVLNLGRGEGKSVQTAKLPMRRRRHASGSFGSVRDMDDWKLMEAAESSNSLGCPSWMMNRGWQWSLHENTEPTHSPSLDDGPVPKFISRHVGLTRDYMVSAPGAHAIGAEGYLPTSLARDEESRRKTVEDLLLALHLLLEEEKLDVMSPDHAETGRTDLRVILCQLSRWVRWHSFMALYELGIQEDVERRYDSELSITPPIAAPATCPNVIEWIQNRFLGIRSQYQTPNDIYYTSSQLSEDEKLSDTRWDSIVPRTMIFKRLFRLLKPTSTAVEIVEAMNRCGVTKHFIETLPEGVSVPLQDAIALCQAHPPQTWSKPLLLLVKRSDFNDVLRNNRPYPKAASGILAPSHNATWDFRLLCQSLDESNNLGYEDGEGTERQAVIRALFKEDRRLNEAQNLLSTHKSRTIRFDPDPSWSESEYLEKQKDMVARIATGTLAIPAGRAMLYYSLRFPLITQKLHIGGFNLNCIVKPANVTVGVDKSMFSEDKVCWGFFHQGVAAGLAISPHAKGIDTSWILYNKPTQELSNRHAGFLLALGLNGHLRGVAKWVAFKYLTPKHTMTSIGLLLGLAVSYMGTMDSLITRLLSVHATRMLPRGAAELNLSPLTQTSGIMGIGLLYCNTQHRRMSEVMLSEIEHIDDEDDEEPLRSECYRLAAGFALGFINLGKGKDLKGLSDMRLTERLITHATSTKIVEIVHVLDRAAAGAVIAIALIFMKTEDQTVARKIDVPESTLQFDYVRPDILLLRTVAKNLILWSEIEPTMPWVEASLPLAYRGNSKLASIRKLRSTDLPFFSILAGICFSIALRFSGSASTKVRDLLLHYLDQFTRISSITPTQRAHPDAAPLYDEELARANARMCQDVLTLSAAIVMAGTGDISVLRRLRALHGRDDPNVPYGSHLSAHLAVGALFLGCGTATFGTSNIAIASLLLSFYPVFPTGVMDNRAHLQAFRHFWVLASEQRCLVSNDVQTGQPTSVPVQIRLESDTGGRSVLHRITPCLLPPLEQISSLSTKSGPRYWDVNLDFKDETLRESFAQTQSLYLRRRPPLEGAFTSALRALGDGGVDDNPMQWILHLDSLLGVSYAQRAGLLDAAENEQDMGGAVDMKMELERGILDGVDMERLESAKLLFDWSSVRHRIASQRENTAAHSTDTEAATITASQQLQAENEGSHEADQVCVPWFMRDNDIESLKGKVWLTAKELDE